MERSTLHYSVPAPEFMVNWSKIFVEIKVFFTRILNMHISLSAKRSTEWAGIYYSSLVSRFEHAETYADMLKAANKNSNISYTDTSIEFSAGTGFGDSVCHTIANEMSGRRYLFEKIKKTGVEILFFKKMVGGHRAKIDMHFYNDKLFCYAYTFSYANDENVREIINVLKNKYSVELNCTNADNCIIKDYNGSIIIISASVELRIVYFNPLKGEVDFDRMKAYSDKKQKIRHKISNRHQLTNTL
jgi:hypothetical protein